MVNNETTETEDIMIKLTPPIGWISRNTYGENINEQVIMETADAMIEQGLLEKA